MPIPREEHDVQYALLIYTQPGADEALDEAQQEAATAEYLALRAEPTCLGGAHLQPVETATSVRVHDGETLTTDGPFADTKEVFGGYFVFEAGDLDAAIELAARVPAARMGGAVEVRPVVEYPASAAESAGQ
jgi:hypothetical protein